jgi:hypothetical protein
MSTEKPISTEFLLDEINTLWDKALESLKAIPILAPADVRVTNPNCLGQLGVRKKNGKWTLMYRSHLEWVPIRDCTLLIRIAAYTALVDLKQQILLNNQQLHEEITDHLPRFHETLKKL